MGPLQVRCVSWFTFCRHCEEPTGPASGRPDDKLRDETIHTFFVTLDCFASLAMTVLNFRAARCFQAPDGTLYWLRPAIGSCSRWPRPVRRLSRPAQDFSPRTCCPD